MGMRPWIACIATFMMIAPNLVQADQVVRRMVYANTSWQGAYLNTTASTQRVLLRSSGIWSYMRGGSCSSAGVPWNEDLRKQADELLAPECAPFSLVGLLSAPGEEIIPICLGNQDRVNLPAGGSISFSVNDFHSGFGDNSGLMRLELLIMDR